jgi:hypothetical protein
MKTNYLLFLLVLAGCLNAQVSLTQAFHEPVLNEVDRNYKLDTAAYNVGLPLNIAGANVVWDFSLLTGIFPVISDTIISPAAAISGSAYPAATYCQKRNEIYTFFKSVSSPSQTELLGAYSPTLSLTFTNTAIIATYPVSYGYTKTDVVSGSCKLGTTNGACNGSITVLADGTGTVIFPFGNTFTNVLRVRSVQELTVSSGLFPIGSINQYIYSYYAPGKKYPILTVQYQKYQFIAGTPTITTLVSGNGNYFSVAGMEEETSRFDHHLLAPNPFQSSLTLTAELKKGLQHIYLYGPTGELVLSAEATTDIDTEALPPGIYLAEVQTRSGIHFQKLIKQ